MLWFDHDQQAYRGLNMLLSKYYYCKKALGFVLHISIVKIWNNKMLLNILSMNWNILINFIVYKSNQAHLGSIYMGLSLRVNSVFSLYACGDVKSFPFNSNMYECLVMIIWSCFSKLCTIDTRTLSMRLMYQMFFSVFKVWYNWYWQGLRNTVLS